LSAAAAGQGKAAEDRFVSAAAVAALVARVRASQASPKLADDHPDGTFPDIKARETCGFFPWACPDLHGAAGARGAVLNHEGMGGCMAYADPDAGLSVVVLKNVYEPLAVIGGSVSPDVCELANAVRAGLGIP